MSFLEFIKYICIYQGIVTGIQLCLRGMIHWSEELKNKDKEDADLRREIFRLRNKMELQGSESQRKNLEKD